jgi:hypothetical protein
MFTNRLSTLKILWLTLAAGVVCLAQTTGEGRSFRASASINGHSPNKTPAASPQFRVAPRILVGKDWETLIVLVNPGPNAVSFQQAFFAGRKPVTLSIRSAALGVDLAAPAIQGVLAPGARIDLLLGPSGVDIQEAWSLLTDPQGVLDGYVVLRRRAQSGDFSFETTIPLSGTQDVSAYVPFDNTQGFRSQLTVVNPASDIAATVRLTYLNPQGGTVLIDSVSVMPAGQLTLTLPDTYPDLANKAGTILIETDTDRLSVVGLRQNLKYGVISALPALR